jgi:hypothetical protein
MFEIRPAILQGGFRFFISLAKIHRMLKKKIAIFLSLPFFILVVRFSEAQTGTLPVSVSRDSLRALAGLIQRGGNDSIRISANAIFQNHLRAILLKSSFSELDSIKNISVLVAPDKSFRIITWTRPSYEGSYFYYGFIQTVSKKTHQVNVIDLIDSTYSIEKPEMAKLNPSRWYGAVYYKMLVNKKGGKNYYTLLGWKGNSPLTTQKVIEVFYFAGDKPMFGFPLLKTEKVYHNRIIFEYVSQASMSLRYEESKKMIVFDHLSSGGKSELNSLNGPDGSYDALKFKNGRWELLRDVDVNAGYVPKVSQNKVVKDEDLKK